ncbi:MAG TPA: hypothetical protein EYG54_01310 [Myxococcales bacterium]|nr:hypothetical protein [Myxococcales bacterium]
MCGSSMREILSRKTIGLAVGLAFAVLLVGCDGMGPADRTQPSPDAEAMQREVDAALVIPNLSERFIALGATLSGLTAENAPGAGAAYAENIIIVRGCEVRPFASAWGRLDPAAAIEFALNLQRHGSQRRREAISEVVASWAAIGEGKDAMDFLATLAPGSEDQRVVARNLATGLAGLGNWDGAIRVLGGIPDGEPRDMLLFKVYRELLRTEPDGIRNFVDSIPVDAPNNLKAKAFARSLALLASLNPDYAREWFQKHMLTDYATGEAIKNILDGLVIQDPSEAVRWLASVPPSAARDDGLRDAAYRWLKGNPGDAYEYLRPQLHKAEFAPAIFPFAQFMILQDPKDAVDWARRVPHPVERYKVLTQALIKWGRIDRRAVVQWVRETPEVDEAVRKEVVKALKIEPHELT